ncbi:hypothetical protein ACM26V_04820 [Salipaludibacillus sp. HK11]|uniref:hypothetical protein n=1 Tax=Salipaludibacillus sp. HK11 TaxID=3394320 RepID=UPI0039FD250B
MWKNKIVLKISDNFFTEVKKNITYNDGDDKFEKNLLLLIERNRAHTRVMRIISTVYRLFIVIAFLGIIPIGFLFLDNFWVSIVAVLGTLVSTASVVLTLKTNSNKKVNFSF